MIIHTVAFKTSYPLGSREESRFLSDGMALARLPMVRDFRCYRQVSAKNAYTHGFSMEFESQAAYDAYNIHPIHVAFVKTRWKTVVESFLELDYVRYDPS